MHKQGLGRAADIIQKQLVGDVIIKQHLPLRLGGAGLQGFHGLFPGLVNAGMADIRSAVYPGEQAHPELVHHPLHQAVNKAQHPFVILRGQEEDHHRGGL